MVDQLEAKLIDFFENHSEVRKIDNCNVGHLGRTFKNVSLYWSDNHKLWFFPRESSRKCYWNAFGLEDPQSNQILPIDVEINFSFDGTCRRIGGLLFTDENNNYFIGHRGNIKPSKHHFWKEYTGRCVDVYSEDNRFETIAFVGEIGQVDFLNSLREFIVEIKRIKNLVRE